MPKAIDKRTYLERLQDLQENYLNTAYETLPHYIGKDKIRIRYGLKSGSEAEKVYLTGRS